MRTTAVRAPKHHRYDRPPSPPSPPRTSHTSHTPRPAGARRPHGRSRVRAWRRSVVVSMTTGREAGMATAEYAIATIAAVGFAGLLILVLKSQAVRSLLAGLIESALSVA